VRGNFVDGAATGIVLNDAFDTTVEANHVHGASIGIGLVRHFDDPAVNRGLVIAGNRVTGAEVGISLGGLGAGCELVGNDLATLGEAQRIVERSR
jgi:nitrous oxidase accessory protein NosD